MTIKTLEVAGIGPAIRAMRNPYSNWDKSDTVRRGKIGDKDKALSEKLTQAGPAHCKHTRLIQVWAEIIAPRYWWEQFATHRLGMEMLSTSTMHTLMREPITAQSFAEGVRQEQVAWLEEQRQTFWKLVDEEQKKKLWREIIINLPQSFLQRRTVMMSYQCLHNIYELRKGHKLAEWYQFIEWIESLPEAWIITGKEGE